MLFSGNSRKNPNASSAEAPATLPTPTAPVPTLKELFWEGISAGRLTRYQSFLLYNHWLEVMEPTFRAFLPIPDSLQLHPPGKQPNRAELNQARFAAQFLRDMADRLEPEQDRAASIARAKATAASAAWPTLDPALNPFPLKDIHHD